MEIIFRVFIFLIEIQNLLCEEFFLIFIDVYHKNFVEILENHTKTLLIWTIFGEQIIFIVKIL